MGGRGGGVRGAKEQHKGWATVNGQASFFWIFLKQCSKYLLWGRCHCLKQENGSTLSGAHKRPNLPKDICIFQKVKLPQKSKFL